MPQKRIYVSKKKFFVAIYRQNDISKLAPKTNPSTATRNIVYVGRFYYVTMPLSVALMAPHKFTIYCAVYTINTTVHHIVSAAKNRTRNKTPVGMDVTRFEFE